MQATPEKGGAHYLTGRKLKEIALSVSDQRETNRGFRLLATKSLPGD